MHHYNIDHTQWMNNYTELFSVVTELNMIRDDNKSAMYDFLYQYP